MNLLAYWIGLAGDKHEVEIFGYKMLGLNADIGWRLLITVGYVAVILIVGFALRGIARLLLHNWKGKHIAFWIQQVIRLLTTLLILIGIISIWFANSEKLATFFGLFSAGLVFALQRVVTAFAGYVVILRGKTFSVGDRITMGGVRGDVVALGFIQTTIMEMGQTPGEQQDDPAMWIRARQYTGRIVTVTNDKLFDTPVYNYTREFPYIWDEMRMPISYKDDRAAAERIMLETARQHTLKFSEVADKDLKEMERRYVMKISEMEPRIYWRLTDNWIEMTVRFLAPTHGIRKIKDAMSRHIIAEFDKAGVGVASGTYDIVGLPPIHVSMQSGESESKKLSRD